MTDANPSYSRDITGERNPMYGRGLNGEANPMYGKRREASPRWTGGRKVRKDGYVFVAPPEGHPHGGPYMLEHRLVMEGVLGRYLRPEEVVHHIDGNPSNNAPENLQLFADNAEHMAVAHPTPGRREC